MLVLFTADWCWQRLGVGTGIVRTVDPWQTHMLTRKAYIQGEKLYTGGCSQELISNQKMEIKQICLCLISLDVDIQGCLAHKLKFSPCG